MDRAVGSSRHRGGVAGRQGAKQPHNLVVVDSSPTRPTIVEFLTYHLNVPETQPLEDERGVDTAQIRALLRLSPAERCAHMVEVANTMLAIREHAQAART